MESFSEFFQILDVGANKKSKKYGKTKKPHHRNDRRITNRSIETRDGESEGIGFMPNKYKRGDHNFDQDENQRDTPLSNQQAIELCTKHKIDIRKVKPHIGKSLGKREFEIVGFRNNYHLKKKAEENIKPTSQKGYLND